MEGKQIEQLHSAVHDLALGTFLIFLSAVLILFLCESDKGTESTDALC